MRSYFRKFTGVTQSPPRAPMAEVVASWIGGFLGILAVGFLGSLENLGEEELLFLIGSFGASAVLIYGAPTVPYAQPRNLVGGHVISAAIGVAVFSLLPEPIYLSGALAVATAIAAMHLTKTIHPPGGASALIAVIGSTKVHGLGFLYVLTPVGAGALIMLVVALLVNNLFPQRRYPQFWW